MSLKMNLSKAIEKTEVDSNRRINLIGKRFDKLIVTSFYGTHNQRSVWYCKCDCGNFIYKRSDYLSDNDTNSCGCLYKKSKKDPSEVGLQRLYNSYLKRAQKKKWAFELTKEDIKYYISNNCFYCNDKPSNLLMEHKKVLLKFNGIDRKDPLIGYIKENCVSCCSDCNYMKHKMIDVDFLNKIKKIFKNRILE